MYQFITTSLTDILDMHAIDEISLSENIARGKNTTQSKAYGYSWSSSYAVDGIKDIDHASSAISDNTKGGPWWQLDLGEIYDVSKIDIFGITDTDGETKEFDVYVGNSEQTMNHIYHNLLVRFNYKAANGHIVIYTNTSMRFIKIQNENISYLTLYEVEVFRACNDYQFEPNCEECHCREIPCNKFTGVCPAECEPPWIGVSCNKTCGTGFYGKDCSGICNCLNPSQCDKWTGLCKDSLCVFGFTGNYCNMSSSITAGKNVTMVNQHYDWRADFAVDGNLITLADKCKCCSATKYGTSPWLEIDLGRYYRVAYITVYGRTDYNNDDQSYKGLAIFASSQFGTHPMHIHTHTVKDFFLNITLNEPVKAWYLRFVLDGRNRLLVICEVQAFGKDCDSGMFGEFCEHYCHCDGDSCDGKTGICPSGNCQDGFRGQNCSIECEGGTYGKGCGSRCGNCINGTACDRFNGTCESCSPGYVGNKCIQPCAPGLFGTECFSMCGNCLEGTNCNHVTGICQAGCRPGYQSIMCNETCPMERYGINCKHTCGKCFNNTCDIYNGHCDSEGCLDGYVPPLCSLRIKEQSGFKGDVLSTGALSGIIVGGVGLVVVVVVGVVVLRRKGQSKNKAKKNVLVEDIDRHKETNMDGTEQILGAKNQTKREECLSDGIVKNTTNISQTETKAVDASDYYEYTPRQTDVKIHQLWDYTNSGLENKCSWFKREFGAFRKGLQFECKAASMEENILKNRYKEIYAYDHNRVRFQTADGYDERYINASFLDGYEKVKKFIATQGPTKDMVEDFFDMIWQQRCNLIVMLTDTFENGVLKCLQYWPVGDDYVSFGEFTVVVNSEDSFPDYIIRCLTITKANEGKHEIKQFHFLSWPDKSIPATAWSLVNFWRAVDKAAKLENPQNPILVHCSAGVGRTGTFIALDNLYNQAIREGCIRPVQMVETLRRQRVNMVQTSEQYAYMHEAVAEALLVGTHFILTAQFEEMYKFLTSKMENGTKSYLEHQWELLEMSLEETSDERTGEEAQPFQASSADAMYSNEGSVKLVKFDDNVAQENVYTNVRETKLADAKVEKKSLTVESFPDFKNEESFRLAKEPSNDDECVVFWKYVVDNHSTTVIHLKAASEKCLENNKFPVKKELSREKYSMKDVDTKGQAVRLFEYFGWKTGENVLEDQESLLEMISEIFQWQTTLSSKMPVIIVKRVSDYSGVVCVVLNELGRISSFGRVNILETVKHIRQRNKNVVQTFEQYRLCHEIILKNIKSENDVYQNV